MFEVTRAGFVAIERNCGAGEIKSAAVRSRYNFDRVGIADFFRRTGSLYGSDLRYRVFHYFQQAGNLFRADERFVALHVDINIGCD